MRRTPAFRPSLDRLEHRIVPTIGAYPDPVRTAMHESFVARAESGPTNVVFLGDSITYRWGLAGESVWQSTFASTGAVDFGVSGDQTQNVLYRVENGELAGKPKVVVLMVGINDLFGDKTPAQAEEGISEIITAIKAESPTTQVLLLSVLPTASSALNDQVTQLDSLLPALGKQAGVTYLDIEADFMGANNVVQAGDTVDGVHPTTAGYTLLAQAIDPTLTSLLNPTTTTTTAATVATKPSPNVLPTVTATPATTIIPIDLGTTTTTIDTTQVTPTVHHKSTSTVSTTGLSS